MTSDDLSPGTPGQSFRESRLSLAVVKQLLARCGNNRAAGKQLLELTAFVGSAPLGEQAPLATLLGRPPEPELVVLLRDHFLELADRRLQCLYRDFYAANPPPSVMLHEERVGLLGAVADRARTMVAAQDWPWLAEWLGLQNRGESASSCLRRLSTYAHRVTKVNLRFTYHCNFRCAHCYNSSGPERKAERLTLPAMLEIVDQMPALALTELNLTGGEPLLYPDDVAAVIVKARAVGVDRISIMTNGWWSETPDQAARMMDRLAAAGFMTKPGDYIKVSAGVHHQPFLALDRILSLARPYRAKFGAPLIVDYEYQGPADKDGVLAHVASSGVEDVIKLRFRTVSAIGRGIDIETRPVEEFGNGPCFDIDQIVFDPDGSIRPCCGLNADNLGVRIGSHPRHGLAAAMMRIQNDPILQFLATRPLRDLAPYLKRDLRAGHDSLCQVCEDLLGDLADREQLMAALFPLQRFYPFSFHPDDARAALNH